MVNVRVRVCVCVLALNKLIPEPQSSRKTQVGLISVSLLSALFKRTPYQWGVVCVWALSALCVQHNNVRCYSTLAVVSISAALYPCIDECPPSIPAMICHAIHYPSVCFSWLLNDLSARAINGSSGEVQRLVIGCIEGRCVSVCLRIGHVLLRSRLHKFTKFKKLLYWLWTKMEHRSKTQLIVINK